MVITKDFESFDPGSSPGRTLYFFRFDTKNSFAQKYYTPCGIQTRNPQIRSLMRYSIAPTGHWLASEFNTRLFIFLLLGKLKVEKNKLPCVWQILCPCGPIG